MSVFLLCILTLSHVCCLLQFKHVVLSSFFLAQHCMGEPHCGRVEVYLWGAAIGFGWSGHTAICCSLSGPETPGRHPPPLPMMVAEQLATNTTIIFLLLNGCLFLCPHRLRHMRPRSTELIPSLRAETKLSKVVQNTHMATQIRCRACPNIADNHPLPQRCKGVLHPCMMETMDIVILLLVFTQGFPTNMRYSGV